MTTHDHAHENEPGGAQGDANANPEDSENVSAGEQVLDEGHVTPSQDDFLDDASNGAEVDDEVDAEVDAEPSEPSGTDGGSKGDAHAADERTDPGAPPAQGDPG